MAYRLLSEVSEQSFSNLSSWNIPAGTRGTTMDFGVFIIANSLLAAFMYVILDWLWQS